MKKTRKRKQGANRRARNPEERRAKLGSALAALTTSALALPGLLSDSARADAPTELFDIDLAYSYYHEDDLPAKKSVDGIEEERMTVHSFQVHGKMPLPKTDRWDLDVDLMVESMSGASPWFVQRDAETGGLVQVMSGPSIFDDRVDMNFTAHHYGDSSNSSYNLGFSVEDDYRAVYFGWGRNKHFNDKNTTLSLGWGYSNDRVMPTDHATYERRAEYPKESTNAFLGLSQIFSQSAIVQSSLTYRYAWGFLSDPYKKVSVAGDTDPDTRPEKRHQLSWLTSYRQHVEAADGTLHVDFRYYYDSWEIQSLTVETAWYQSLFDYLQLVPSFRYYSQSGANFYQPVYATRPENGHMSSDYRLSPFGALSMRIAAVTHFEGWPRDVAWEGSISYQRYLSGATYGIETPVEANPGLVDFSVLAIRLSARF
jgi:hypothetical protein